MDLSLCQSLSGDNSASGPAATGGCQSSYTPLHVRPEGVGPPVQVIYIYPGDIWDTYIYIVMASKYPGFGYSGGTMAGVELQRV